MAADAAGPLVTGDVPVLVVVLAVQVGVVGGGGDVGDGHRGALIGGRGRAAVAHRQLLDLALGRRRMGEKGEVDLIAFFGTP